MKPLILLMLMPLTLLAQEAVPPVPTKKAFVDSVGRYYQQASMPIYLWISNSPDQSPTALKPAVAREVYLEGHGVHTLKHENHKTNQVDEFLIHADGLAPLTLPTFSGAAVYQTATQPYYGPGLRVTLASKDEMSGVENIYHSLNGAAYGLYTPLDFSKEGKYSYRYYGVDRTGNAEPVRVRLFTVDTSAPNTYHHFISISSQQVISTNSSIYLTSSDTLSGVAKTFYRFDKENYRLYAGGNIPFQYLADGDHVLTYFSTDQVGNKEAEKSMKFYLDKTAPIMSADVLGDKFIVGERVYFSGRTKLKLTAVDNKSGVKEVLYSINDQPYVKYVDPFYLPNRSGLHNVKFYANDHTANQAKNDFQHEVGVIYVDLTGPALAHQFVGPSFVKADTVFISPKTTVSITGHDPEAGLKKITYQIDGAADESTYSKPLSITARGLHRLTYAGYDNVNNKNMKDILFVFDTQGPSISSRFAAPANAEGKYPSYTTIYLAAEDQEVGADQIRFSINGGKEQIYSAPLRGFAKNKSYTLKVTATDLLGNTTQSEIVFKTDRY